MIFQEQMKKWSHVPKVEFRHLVESADNNSNPYREYLILLAEERIAAAECKFKTDRKCYLGSGAILFIAAVIITALSVALNTAQKDLTTSLINYTALDKKYDDLLKLCEKRDCKCIFVSVEQVYCIIVFFGKWFASSTQFTDFFRHAW